tara:strand:- start:110 stop:235 length:126 start_codon:yes stop_codon:yes gene_type:complete
LVVAAAAEQIWVQVGLLAVVQVVIEQVTVQYREVARQLNKD